MATVKTYRPEQIASALGISGKIVRAYLRQTFPRPANAKGTTWVLSESQAKQTLAHFKARNPQVTPTVRKSNAKATPKANARPRRSADAK